MSRVIIVIPARLGSTRFPRKPLTLIKGHTGADGQVPKTLIQRTWEVAAATGLRAIVATDDWEIGTAVVGFGGEVTMTPDYLRNGTERCAFMAAFHQWAPDDIVINLQGDACLTPPEWLPLLADYMRATHAPAVATIVSDWEGTPRLGDVVAFSDILGCAHRFERYRGGYLPDRYTLRHFGVYAYRVRALQEYLACGEIALETMEGLEQQRWAHLGFEVGMVFSPEGVRLPACEVNAPGDVLLVEAELQRWGIE